MPDAQPESLNIRRGVEADLVTLVEIERSAFPDPWSEASLAEELAGDLPPIVVECEGAVRGYLCQMAGPGERHVTNIAVHRDWRRRGLGRLLLESAIRAAKKASCHHLFLEVRPSNEPARRLYSRLGFVELYRRRGYYIRPSEDGLVMVLSLERGQRRPNRPHREEI